MFLNEHRNQWYSTGSYFWSKNLFEFIRLFIIDYICFFVAYYGASEPDVVYWYQGFWDIPQRLKLFSVYSLIAIQNLHGNLIDFEHLIIEFIW